MMASDSAGGRRKLREGTEEGCEGPEGREKGGGNVEGKRGINLAAMVI